MKTIYTLLIALFFSVNFASAQDTLYIYRAGIVVTKRAVSEIDSISFTRNYSQVNQVAATDIDGNQYHSVKIGTQTWMVENLKTTKYRTGASISHLTNAYDWSSTMYGAWSDYNNDNTFDSIYGKLYNWFAIADSRNLAPEGWHVATNAEWTILQNYLISGGYNYDGTNTGNKIAKSLSSTTLWSLSSNPGAIGNDLTKNNKTGFTSLPGGYQGIDGQYYWLGSGSEFWTSTEYSTTNAMHWVLGCTTSNLNFADGNKNYGCSVRCVKDTITIPTVTTTPVSAITETSAIIGGKITNNGGSILTAHGVCWSTTPQPTILNSKTTLTGDSTFFTVSINGLASGSTYYVRAYATNSAGTAYGEQVSFITVKYDSLSIKDIDGNVYHSVKIGLQTWMVEDLKTTKYSNGDLIGTTNPITKDIADEVSPKYQWAYNGNDSNAFKYGRLYTWYAATDSRKIAPKGWHVASDAEWITLQNYLIANGYNYDGTKTDNKIAKSICSTSLWAPCLIEGAIGNDLTKNNSSGFSAVPGGYRGTDGTFYILNWVSDHWTSTENSSDFAWIHALGYTSADLGYYSKNKNYGFSIRCIKDTIAVPVIITSSITGITNSSAVCGGKITTDGGGAVTDKGICWSTTSQPTLLNNKITVNSDSTFFSCSITGLLAGSTYYVRAYATNSAGTAYGDQANFSTIYSDALKVTDIDGNVYNTVKIGNQLWMAENLKTTRFNDSTSIPNVTDQVTWATLTTPGYCWYNDSIYYKNSFGALYNWYTVNSGKLAPKGWHVATDEEWAILTTFLGDSVAGGKLKETGTLNWTAPNTGATNVTGFTALPGGGRGYDNGTFDFKGTISFWWTSTVLDDTYARFRSIGYNNSGVGKSGSGKDNGLYVRCVKD